MFNYKNNKPLLFISPPFGNYINLPNVIPIRGSFTLKKRPGKWMQILKTLRYNFTLGGWVNKIGLRNKGIDYAIEKYISYFCLHLILTVVLGKKFLLD